MDEQQMEMFQEFQQMDTLDTPTAEITVQAAEEVIRKYKNARDEYDKAKRLASEANAKKEQLENEVMGLLEKLGRSSFEVEGLCRVTKCMSLVYRTPKSNEDKEKLFEYIKNKYGPDVHTAMVSVNHQTLNSWANKEMESGASSIPGLEAPTHTEYLQMRSRE